MAIAYGSYGLRISMSAEHGKTTRFWQGRTSSVQKQFLGGGQGMYAGVRKKGRVEEGRRNGRRGRRKDDLEWFNELRQVCNEFDRGSSG